MVGSKENHTFAISKPEGQVMAKSRNTLSHVYDEEEVLPIVRLIYSDYAPLLKKLDEDLNRLSQNTEYQQV